MGGTKKRGVWTNADHMERDGKRNKKKVKQFERSQRLTHGTEEKFNTKKIQLHITKTERQVTALRDRLRSWDDVTEEKRRKDMEEAERKKRDAADPTIKKPRRRRLGPETWKLRGAARPAWEVYDFDVRYECPHIKAHEDAKGRAGRSRNLLLLYKGKFGNSDSPEVCRDYLIFLMRLALLYKQAKKFKSARTTFLECLELDSEQRPITCARSHLMRIYLNANRPHSARRLWGKLSPKDANVWIRYSHALVEYTAWKDDKEGSSQAVACEALSNAIRANIYCAYYLAFGNNFFDDVMEYVEEIVDATEEEPLEESIEYCNSEQRQSWEENDGAVEWVQAVILDTLQDKNNDTDMDQSTSSTLPLSKEDLDWRGALQQLEKAAKADFERQEEGHINPNNNSDDQEPLEEVDALMFSGMFRTAMEMVEEKFGL